MKAVIDIDFVKYAAASAGEKRSVTVRNKHTGERFCTGSRTEWYGTKKDKKGGLLHNYNVQDETDYSWDDFTYEDVQTLEPIENVLHTAKVMVESSIKKSGASSYKAFIGKGIPDRVERSTIIEYKGNRKGLLKPLYLDDVSAYLTKRFNVEVVEGIEADDACVMEAQDKKSFIIGVDKDYYGCNVSFWNYNRADEGIVNCRGLGKLWLDEKGKVRGRGRLFFYFQVLSGDAIDNYHANSASDIKWAEKSAYKALVNCKSDNEALKALVDNYKLLYPEEKEIIGWRGEPIMIDWLYVLAENFDLARMLRHKEDVVDVRDVLDKRGLL